MKFEKLKKELLKDRKFRKEYERFDLWFELQEKWLDLKIWLNKHPMSYNILTIFGILLFGFIMVHVIKIECEAMKYIKSKLSSGTTIECFSTK